MGGKFDVNRAYPIKLREYAIGGKCVEKNIAPGMTITIPVKNGPPLRLRIKRITDDGGIFPGMVLVIEIQDDSHIQTLEDTELIRRILDVQ